MGVAGVFLFLFRPSRWGILGQGGVQRLAITSAQPLLSGTLLLSSSLSFPPPVGVRIAVSRASSLIQFPLLHILFLPASTTFAFVMGHEWLQFFIFFFGF